MNRLGNLITGLLSLLTGMSVTLKTMFRTLGGNAVTLQYPHEKPELSPNFRSAIKLIRFDETDSHDCVACLQCEKICPSFCIKIEGGKIEGIKKKRATKFTMDFALCSLCGLCLDVCPTTTLEYSKLYDDASYSRDWNFDLLEEFTEFEPTFIAQQKEREAVEAAAREAKKKAAKAAKEAAAAAKAAAEAASASETPAEEA
ncbi:MAG: NuoI/complex I 23 kDa subunit family protein [Myxococcota bacterium]